MTLDVEKGGRAKKAPYETTHCRVPVPVKPLIEKIILVYKRVAGFPFKEAKALKTIEDAVARATYPDDEKPVNGFKSNAEVGRELVQEYLQSLGVEGIPLDEKGKPKPRYDHLAKFVVWLENK